jgi:hypothetical protein
MSIMFDSTINVTSNTARINEYGGIYHAGKSLPLSAKIDILKVYLHLQEEPKHHNKPVSTRQLAAAAKCGKETARKIVREYRETGVLSDPNDASQRRIRGVGNLTFTKEDVEYLLKLPRKQM